MTLLPDDHEVRSPPASPDPHEAARARCLRRIYELDTENLQLAAAVLEELPFTKLVATCEAETQRGVESAEKKLTMLPTSRRVVARAKLLGALRALRVVLGLPRRAYLGVNGHLQRARTGQP